MARIARDELPALKLGRRLLISRTVLESESRRFVGASGHIYASPDLAYRDQSHRTEVTSHEPFERSTR